MTQTLDQSGKGRGMSAATAKKLSLSVIVMLVTFFVAQAIVQPRQMDWGATRGGQINLEQVTAELVTLGIVALIGLTVVWFFSIKRLRSLVDSMSGMR